MFDNKDLDIIKPMYTSVMFYPIHLNNGLIHLFYWLTSKLIIYSLLWRSKKALLCSQNFLIIINIKSFFWSFYLFYQFLTLFGNIYGLHEYFRYHKILTHNSCNISDFQNLLHQIVYSPMRWFLDEHQVLLLVNYLLNCFENLLFFLFLLSYLHHQLNDFQEIPLNFKMLSRLKFLITNGNKSWQEVYF